MSDYHLYPLQKLILKDRMRYELDLKRTFKKNIDATNIVNKEIKTRIHNKGRKNWVIIEINGETGSMKSSVALSIMKQQIDKKITAAQVTQEYTTFEELLSKSKPKQGFILDELVFQRGTGSTRIKENILNLVETLRKRQNSMIFVTPTEKFIGDENFTFILEPCGFNEKNKTVRCLVKKKRYLGFYYVKLLWESKLWKEYEKGKDEFIERSAQQKYKKLDYEEIARQAINNTSTEELSNLKRIRLWLEKNARNMTREERDLLAEQIRILQGH